MSPALLQYHIHSNKDKRLNSNATKVKNETRIKNNDISTVSNSNSNSNIPVSSYFMDTLGLGITWL